MELKLDKKHGMIITGVVFVVAILSYFYFAKPISEKVRKASKEMHPLNLKHGKLKAWLSDSCPWCTKQVKVFEEEGIIYEKQTGKPPSGDGVPQTQSPKTGKVCDGFRKADELAECLG
tara:strand:+ start:49 stop:402 length:354 start_codon:yes stop_codon:yes gene_type:complete